MTETTRVRERYAWIAAVAVLATSMAWLSMINVAIVLRGHAVELPTAFVIAKTLVRAMVLIARQGWPVWVASVLAWSLIAVVASAMLQGRRWEEGARHA
jgi:hypothetical protein